MSVMSVFRFVNAELVFVQVFRKRNFFPEL